MTLTQKLGKSSLVYTVSNLLQRGISFFLLPLYTHFLAPEDYGILAVVTTLSGFLSILFTWSMPAAIGRFYFDYRDDPDALREFWGTVICSILFFSFAGGVLLLWAGPVILKPIMGDIPFWPFFAIGIGTLVFQPFFQIFLSTLQVQGLAGRYALYSTIQLVINLALVLTLVVLLKWKAEGPLFASLATSIIFFLITLGTFRKNFKWVFRWDFFKQAARYSLPLVPHSLSAQILVVTDKFFLNTMIGAASAGIYHIAYLLGTTIIIIADSINRAYVPVAMEALQESKPSSLEELKSNGMALIGGYCLIGTLVSLFASEVLQLFTAKPFHTAYQVVPLIAFGFVLRGIYYILVNILMFKKEATGSVSVGTFTAALANVALNFSLIPKYGMMGAALATLVSQLIMTLIIGKLALKHEPFRWDYEKICLAFIVCLIISNSILLFTEMSPVSLLILKILAGGLTAIGLGIYIKGDAYFYFRMIPKIPRLFRNSATARPGNKD